MKSMKKLLAPLSFLVLLGYCLPADGMQVKRRKIADFEKKLKSVLKKIELGQTLEEIEKAFGEGQSYFISKDIENKKAKIKLPLKFFDTRARLIEKEFEKRGRLLIERGNFFLDENKLRRKAIEDAPTREAKATVIKNIKDTKEKIYSNIQKELKKAGKKDFSKRYIQNKIITPLEEEVREIRDPEEEEILVEEVMIPAPATEELTELTVI